MKISEGTNSINIINDQLTNNKDDTDEDMYDFLRDSGVSPALAQQAIRLRGAFFTDPFAKVVMVNGQLSVQHSKYAK